MVEELKKKAAIEVIAAHSFSAQVGPVFVSS
jgi:hypothetical protein